MIHGVGVDLVSVARFEKFARDHAHRLPEMFTAAERKGGVARMAAAFAVKEAALKAIGGLTGWELDWSEIRAPSGDAGAVTLAGKVAAHAKTLGVKSVSSSITRFTTDGEGFEMACVIAERREP
jgi:holo-[acyl-carrier protein] synthase